MVPDIVNMTPVTGRMIAEGNLVKNIVDETLPGVRVVDADNFVVHLGIAFIYREVAQLAAGGVMRLLGRVGAKEVHLTDFLIRCDQAPVTIEFFESPTVTAPGTAGTPIAKNRIVSAIPTTSVFLNPTVTSDGTRLDIDKLLGANKDVGGRDLHTEWLLKPNTDYIFKITNSSAQIANIVAGFIWSETPVV